MATEVYMDIPQVQNMANRFKQFGDVLDGIAKVMEGLLTALRISAWLSLGATVAAERYVERVQKAVKRAAEKMRELHNDLESAIKAYRDGDYSGSKRFC